MQAEKRDIVGLQEQVVRDFLIHLASCLVFSEVKELIILSLQVFVRKIIELHDKYLAYVNDCFQNHSLFHKVCYTVYDATVGHVISLVLRINFVSLLGTQRGF